MNPSSAKKKGKLLEDYTADQIVAKGLDSRARRNADSGAGNREKADVITSMQILDKNAGIECKNQKTLSIPAWWKQTTKLEDLGYEPVLVFKFNRESLEGAKVVIYLDTLLELIKAAEGVTVEKTVELDSRNVKYKLDRASHAVKELIKELKVYENE